MHEQKPWLKFYGDIPEHIDYPRVTMYEALMQTVSRSPEAIAYDFFGYTATYRQFGTEIDRCADALAALGLKQGDRVTISMPTCPQGIICFYAANKLGAVASMIHPLSPAKEIAFYLNTAKSRFALTLELPPGYRVPGKPPLHAGRQNRLQHPRTAGGCETEGRREILRRMIPDEEIDDEGRKLRS